MALRIGTELRRRRHELGLTLRQVADEAELSRGFLSQVENERVSPSLKSLEKLSEVLRVPLFKLLSPQTGNPMVKRKDREVVRFGDAGVEVSLLTPFRDWQMLPFQRTLAPGEDYTAVRINQAREEWILVQSGELEVTLYPDDSFRLEPGDTIHFESSRLVGMKGHATEPTNYICMMTPPAIPRMIVGEASGE